MESRAGDSTKPGSARKADGSKRSAGAKRRARGADRGSASKANRSRASIDTKGAQTRRAILDAAIVRFGNEGYRSASVARIARDAGVGGTVAYAYFPNKEALFFAAVDEDAAAVIDEALSSAREEPKLGDWPLTAILTLMESLAHHPLARRLLAGLEPEVTERVMEIPALSELRKTVADRIRDEQMLGHVRDDIEPVTIANGTVSIILSLLMSTVQLGESAIKTYGEDVAAVFTAVIEPRRA